MCNTLPIVLNIKRLFAYFLFLSIIKPISARSIRRHDECDQFLNATDCYYFPCLEAHYSCGPDSHLVRFSYDLCSLATTTKYTSLLKSDAQFYFAHTNQCAMMAIHDQLIEERISGSFTCTHLQAMIFKIYLNCFQSTQRESQRVKVIDFCSIICDDLQTIINFFLNLSSTYINLHQLLIQTGKACGADVNESIVHTIPSLLISICLDRKNVRLKQDITHIMLDQRYEATDYEWI